MADETKNRRLISLDVFRGMTIAGMILVNNPGSWETIYPPLKHAEWHGITPTDFIFPFFLFIVGVSISFSLGRTPADDERKSEKYTRIFRRFALIFAIGLFLAAFPYFEFSTLRIPGVLQRIAICYLVGALLFLNFSWKQQAVLAAAVLIAYWLLMTAVPVPGCEITTIADRACNLSAYIDRQILGTAHIWKYSKVFDPEGLLSTLPAIATTISGVLTGTWLRSNRGDHEKVAAIFFFGVALCALGWFWNLILPFNKSIWTSSYTVYTSGLALLFLGFCYWLIDIAGYKKWSKPFMVFGVNALALYIGAELTAKLLDLIKVTGDDGQPGPLQGYIFETVFLPLAIPVNASLFYALCFILFWLGIMWILYWRRIFIKV